MVLPVLLATVAVLAIAPCPSAPFLYSPRHAQVCPYDCGFLRRQTDCVALLSVPSQRSSWNVRTRDVQLRLHRALPQQAALSYEQSLQPAFVNIIVVGMNMNFLNAGNDGIRGMTAKYQWWNPDARASLGIGERSPSRYFTHDFRSLMNASAISWLKPLRTTMRCTVTCVRSTGIG